MVVTHSSFFSQHFSSETYSQNIFSQTSSRFLSFCYSKSQHRCCCRMIPSSSSLSSLSFTISHQSSPSPACYIIYSYYSHIPSVPCCDRHFPHAMEAPFGPSKKGKKNGRNDNIYTFLRPLNCLTATHVKSLL